MLKRNNTSDINSVIGENSTFKGTFSLKGALKVDGCYEGDNLKVESLFISKIGKIRANIEANLVVVEGIIIGNVKAKNRIMLMPTSRILGEIKTPELIIQNGAILEGFCKITSEDNKNIKDSIIALYDKNKV